MNVRLLSLVFAPFAFGTSAFVFVGLITPMAADLQVGVPAVGQLQSVFALACGLGGPILARLLGGFDRKRLLIAVLSLLVVMNVATAMISSFEAIAAIRFAGGLFAALTLPLASTIAVSLVPEVKRPAALATVLAGYTLAFLIGLPLGSVLGDAFGWRAAFWFAGAICLIAVGVIVLATPGHIKAPPVAGVSFRAALAGDNLRLMTITLLGFLATFCTIAYIGPVITETTGVTGAGIGAVQLAIGAGSLLGLPAGAMIARLPIGRGLAILFLFILAMQGVFSLGMLVDLGAAALPVLVIAMSLGSAALFACSPVIQTRLAETAGPAATIAFALNGSMLYFGQGLGATVGGATIAGAGLAHVGVAGAAAAAAGLLVIWSLRKPSQAEA
ncbi:MAG: MFS transporter [Oceanicaulis sp.]